ncbi:MAG: DUF423 domain-containing protein, partial [Rudaea sp.]
MRSSLDRFAAVAAILGAAAVALGAFGAHALRDTLDANSMQVWHTAVEYQFWHVLALLAVATLAGDSKALAWRIAAIAFVAGIVAFCGSLYALALGAPHNIGAITPLGGLCFIVGWLS